MTSINQNDIDDNMEVFESVDIHYVSEPEADAIDSDTSEHIVSECVPPDRAFETFAGKVFDRNGLGSTTPNSSSLMVFDNSVDRLKALKEEIRSFSAHIRFTECIDDKKVSELLADAADVQQELDALRMDDIAAHGAANSLHHLLDKLQQQSRNNSHQSIPQQVDVTVCGDVTEAPDVWHHLQLLEEKVSRLETSTGNMAESTNTSPHVSLTQRVSSMESRIALLDSSRLNDIMERLTHLQPQLHTAETEVDAANEQYNEDTLTSIEQLSYLSHKVSSHENLRCRLPPIVTRLRTLSTLHSLGANVIQRVASLESKAEHTHKDMQHLHQICNKLEDSFLRTAESVQKNCDTLVKRIDSLT